MATCNPTELLAAGKCFDCLDEGLKQTIKLQLLCEIANGSGDSGITQLTGDVTAGPGSGSQAATIAARAVTFAKLQAISTSRVLGRLTAGSGDVEELTITGTGNVVFSASPTLTGTALAEALTMSGRLINSVNGALSAPAVSVTGTPITGGSTSTNVPLVKIGSGANGAYNTSGEMLGVNAPSGFSGYLSHWLLNGSDRAYVTSAGSFVSVLGICSLLTPTAHFTINSDVFLTRAAAANWRFGAADAASPVAQTISVQNVAAGTTDTAGVATTLRGCAGSGNAASGTLLFQLGTPTSSGSTQHAFSTGLTLANVGVGGVAAHAATFGGTVRAAGYTVATLPAAGTAGRIAYVTDATAPTYRGALVGGGAVVCAVFDTGAAWVSV